MCNLYSNKADFKIVSALGFSFSLHRLTQKILYSNWEKDKENCMHSKCTFLLLTEYLDFVLDVMDW